ncbi:MAG TPA: RCC1 domain-containing protein, partial [Candidatus Wunengus sp. YC61]|uniref:RCC1 domain-containing protein n=1 Tax=Candidatus Wunengus sp. YC61 TaxID=3367698 RepID=UPI0040258F6C
MLQCNDLKKRVFAKWHFFSRINRKKPVMIGGLSNVVYVAGGGYHILVLKSDGTVWAWGSNSSGQLGIGSTVGRVRFHVQVSSLSGIIDITGGVSHSLAVKSDGTVWAWGYNGYGQLGNNSTTNSSTPVQV